MIERTGWLTLLQVVCVLFVYAASAQLVETCNEPADYLGVSVHDLPRFIVDSSKSTGDCAVIEHVRFAGAIGQASMTIGAWSRKVTSVRWVHIGFDTLLMKTILAQLSSEHGVGQTIPPDTGDMNRNLRMSPFASDSTRSEESLKRLRASRQDVVWHWHKGEQLFQLRLAGGGDVDVVGYQIEAF
jgi:hypothetical protein